MRHFAILGETGEILHSGTQREEVRAVGMDLAREMEAYLRIEELPYDPSRMSIVRCYIPEEEKELEALATLLRDGKARD